MALDARIVPAFDHPKATSKDLVVQNSGDEILVFDTANNKAVCLNETAAFVWKHCNGRNSVSRITGLLEDKKATAIDKDLVRFALDQLSTEGLLVNPETADLDFNGLTRREVVRKIGFGSLVALPIVSALVAPSAAAAQSCALGQPGTNFVNCGGTVTNCTDVCTMDAFFLSGCCSGAGQIVLNPLGTCTLPDGACMCICA